MARSLIDTLEDHGLVSAEAVERLVYELPFKQISKIREDIEATLVSGTACVANPEETFGPFSFLASSTLRGDSGCSSWGCHTRKAEALARYAAIFCDRLIVPLNVSAHAESMSQNDQRYALARGLLAVVEMRPVIDAGIVKPVRAAHYVCPSCFRGRVPESDRIVEVKNELYSKLFNDFSITYMPLGEGKGKLILHGPADYLEHGELRFDINHTTEYAPAGRKQNRQFELTKEQVQKSGLVGAQFNRMAMDIAAQQVFGLHYNTAYLTDMGGEAEFLKRLHKDDQLAARTSNFCAQMCHSVPLFMNLPVETVMRIRREDYNAFASYRSTLRKILADHIATGGEMSVAQAKELFSDVLAGCGKIPDFRELCPALLTE